MKTVRMEIVVQCPNVTPVGRIDVKRVDATIEADNRLRTMPRSC